jgi:transcription antitermination factor NusG
MGGWDPNQKQGPNQKNVLPAPMPQKDVDEIMAEAGESHIEMEERLAAKPDFPFAEGDFVNVTAGPYMGFAGQVPTTSSLAHPGFTSLETALLG